MRNRKRKKQYNPILLDMNDYTRIEKKKGKYYPQFNKHIVEKNPAQDIAEYYFGHDYLIVSREKDRVVFSFAPSDDIKDWINDCRCGTKNDLDETGIHKGLNDAFQPFKRVIKHELENAGKRGIWFTGTSRGAGLTQIAAKYSAELGYSINCIPFASLMVFNDKARNEFEILPIHCTNVMNVHDIVCSIPLHIMGYRRAGRRKVLRPKWWYFLPFSFIKIHLDYNSNLKRYTK